MPLARIITHTREDALPLANRLEAHGYTVEIVGCGEQSRGAAELEIELDKMGPLQALAHAARLSRGKQVNVFIAPGCVEEPQVQPEEAAVAEQLLEAAESANFANEPVEVPVPAMSLSSEPGNLLMMAHQRRSEVKRASWINAFRAGVQTIGRDVARYSRELVAGFRPVFKRVQVATASTFVMAQQKSAMHGAQLKQRWNTFRQTRAISLQGRNEAKLQQMRRAELERARHLLEQQEERRREAIHKRMAEEERAKQRVVEEQYRRLLEAEEDERRQIEREAQLERQRQEALRLAQERERVARERVERERLAEEARRLRAEEAERRRREREEQVLVQRAEALVQQQREEPSAPETFYPTYSPIEPKPVGEAPVDAVPTPAEPVPTYAYAAPMPPSRFDSDLNSPYHPGWTWAAAAAGAATVGIMLLWTAVSASRSTVQFAPLSPSSWLPPRAAGIQQQVPFGPVKVVVRKAGPAAPVRVVPAATSAVASPLTTAPLARPLVAVPGRQPISVAKPSAAKAQIASSAVADTADDGQEVVTRHFAPVTKTPVPQAGQTANVKRYSDMN